MPLTALTEIAKQIQNFLVHQGQFRLENQLIPVEVKTISNFHFSSE